MLYPHDVARLLLCLAADDSRSCTAALGSWTEVGVTKAEQVTGAYAEHGEGPFWDAVGNQLLFVDLERGAVLAMTDGSTVDRYEFGGVTGGADPLLKARSHSCDAVHRSLQG